MDAVNNNNKQIVNNDNTDNKYCPVTVVVFVAKNNNE